MLQLFRTNQPSTILFLVVYAALLRLQPIWAGYPLPDWNAGPWTEGLAAWVAVQPMWAYVLGTLLLCGQGVALSLHANQSKMTGELNYLPGLFYVTLGSIHPDFMMLSPALLANSFLLLLLAELSGTYRKALPAERLYNAGIWAAAATLCYAPYVALLPFTLASVYILRGISPREWLMAISGFVVPFFLTGIHAFWYDRLLGFAGQFFGYFDWPGGIGGWPDYALLGLFALLVLLGLLSYDGYLQKKVIKTRKDIDLFFVLLLSVGLLAPLAGPGARLHLWGLVPSLALFMAISTADLRQRSLSSGLHFLWLLGILLYQYRDFLPLG